jgi:tellurite resistance protein TerC
MMPRQGAIALIVINLARGAGAIPPSIAGSIEPSSQPTPARTYGHQCGLVRREGQLVLTPLALALIMIEASDLIFALDSIPAIFSITRDPFLVFTSNIMALLGLRSLYFALAGAVDRFRYLRSSLGLLLVLIGSKLLLKDVLVEGPTTVFFTLGAVALILAGGVITSLLFGRRARNSS